MNSQMAELEGVRERLNRLERQNRRLKFAGLSILGLAVAAILMGQASPRKEIRAERFVLIGKGGKKLAELSSGSFVTKDFKEVKEYPLAVHFRLFDSDGKPKVSLSVQDGYPDLSMGSIDTKMLFLTASPDITGLVVKDKKFSDQIRLGAKSAGSPTLELFEGRGQKTVSIKGGGGGSILLGQDGNDRIRLWSGFGTAFGPSMNLWDGKGTSRVYYGLADDGSPSIHLSDEAGKTRAVLGVTTLQVVRTGETRTTPASSLVLFDKNRKVIWEAP